jgi:peptidoglycan/LPS O-acetylase OafA/YrhL
MSGGEARKERIAFLDVARGLAALLVLAEHGLDRCLPRFLPATIGHGNLGRSGVILFLVISGFVIPTSLEGVGSNKRFWLRRFFRLYPAYWLSIAIAFIYSWHDATCGYGLKTADWFLNLTMLQAFFRHPDVWGVFWTLQWELIIYATCSLLFAAGLLRFSGWIAALALTGYGLLGLARPLFAGSLFSVGGQRLLYMAPLAGLVAQRALTRRIPAGMSVAFVLGQTCVMGAVWSLNHLLFPARMTSACLWELACTWGTAYTCFLLLLTARKFPMLAVAGWLGRISYSVYLLHPFVLLILPPWPTWAFLPALLSGTLLISDLAYRLVERPGIQLGRAIERRWWPTTVESSPSLGPLRQAA